MTLLDKLTRKFGRYGVPHVTVAIVLGQALFFLLALQNQAIRQQMTLIPGQLAAEPWRLLTFVFMPPDIHPIFLIFGLYLFWMFGTALEHEWGAFRYNVFLLVGYAATVAAAFLQPDEPATNGYLLTSVFLAFAMLYPDFQLLVFFILPVKVKWLALITWAIYIFTFVTSLLDQQWQQAAVIVAATLNYLIFFGRDIVMRLRGTARRIHREANAASTRDDAMHTCSVCGVTELTDPRQEFRYFPTDEGVKCFCADHYPDREDRS